MIVRFTLEALADIAAIHAYIEASSPRAALRVATRIFAECDRLGEFPQLGHVGLLPGTFERTVAGLPYIIVHELAENDAVVVLNIFHGAQRREAK